MALVDELTFRSSAWSIHDFDCSCAMHAYTATVVFTVRYCFFLDRMAILSYYIRPVVTECICLSVCHDREPCKHGWTDRDVVWGYGLGWGPRKHVLDRSSSPHVNGNFGGENWRPVRCVTVIPPLCQLVLVAATEGSIFHVIVTAADW